MTPRDEYLKPAPPDDLVDPARSWREVLDTYLTSEQEPEGHQQFHARVLAATARDERKRLDHVLRTVASDLLDSGVSERETARVTGIAVTTLRRMKGID